MRGWGKFIERGAVLAADVWLVEAVLGVSVAYDLANGGLLGEYVASGGEVWDWSQISLGEAAGSIGLIVSFFYWIAQLNLGRKREVLA